MVVIRYKLSKATTDSPLQYPSLLTFIQESFALIPDTFHITYIDQDQDHISITNQDDIIAMIETSPTYQLYIHDNQQIADSIVYDNLLNLSMEEGSKEQGLQIMDPERIKKNVEQYLQRMEKVWGDLIIKEPKEENEVGNNDFLNATIQLVESKEISLSKDLMEPTTDHCEQTDILKLIDQRIYESIPIIASMVEKRMGNNNSSNSLVEKSMRLRHKRINRIMEGYPSLALLTITQVVEDTMDLEYEEVLSRIHKEVEGGTK